MTFSLLWLHSGNQQPIKAPRAICRFRIKCSSTVLFLCCVIVKVMQCRSYWLLPTEINKNKFGLSRGSSLCSDSSNAEQQHGPSGPQKGADSQTKSRVPGKVTFQWLQKEYVETLVKHKQAFISQLEACVFLLLLFPELHFNIVSGKIKKTLIALVFLIKFKLVHIHIHTFSSYNSFFNYYWVYLRNSKASTAAGVVLSLDADFSIQTFNG